LVQDYGARLYNPALGRWLSIDPKAYAFPNNSPYCFALNNPIVLVDRDGEIPIVPLLLKMATGAAADYLMQVGMNYYFNDETRGDLTASASKVDKVQILRSSVESIIPIPFNNKKGRLLKAAVTATLDVLQQYGISKIQGKEYDGEQALKDFVGGFITDLAGGGIGDIVAKYGVQSVARGLKKLNITTDIIRKLTGISGNYTGKLQKVNKPDASADALAKKLGGTSRVKFENDPLQREFDVVSDKFIGQTKASGTLGSKLRAQAKATFEAAQETGKSVYYEFEKNPTKEVIDKLNEYSKRYNVNFTYEVKNLQP
jgi:hypothetical protein